MKTFDPIIILSIVIRVVTGIAAYFLIIRKLLRERAKLPLAYKKDNMWLIVSVSTFIAACFGTALFQMCRIEIIPHCNTQRTLDIISLFNSASLLAALIVMYLITYKGKE